VRRAALIALALALGLGCKATDPEVGGDPLDDLDAGTSYADTIISFGPASTPTSCTESLPLCSDNTILDCGPQEVLGPPDDVSYQLPATGRLEVAFRCSQITEKGSVGDEISYEFQVLSTVETGASAVVEVSLDGINYTSLQYNLTQSDQSFDLARAALDMPVIRYVRISDVGGGGISIDAVSAL
jgi:hypothetical protein